MTRSAKYALLYLCFLASSALIVALVSLHYGFL